MLDMCASLALLAAVWAGGLATSQRREEPPDPRAIERRVFELVNRERLRLELRELGWSDKLAAEARRHSKRMAELWFFSHEDPERGGLAARLIEDGIRWTRCGENIYTGRGYADPAAEVVRAWINSPLHRAAMLDAAFTLTATGVVVRVDGTVMVTQDYVRP